MDIPQNGTHYMTFPHDQEGIPLSSWTCRLVKNGQLNQSTPIQLRENLPAIYTFAFANDGEAGAIWSLVVNAAGDTDNYYGETWKVADARTEQAVEALSIEIKNNSGGGSIIGGSTGPSIGRS
jgi:hypothetical protein